MNHDFPARGDGAECVVIIIQLNRTSSNQINVRARTIQAPAALFSLSGGAHLRYKQLDGNRCTQSIKRVVAPPVLPHIRYTHFELKHLLSNIFKFLFTHAVKYFTA